MAADGSAAPLGACPIKAEDMRKMHSYREAIGHRPGPGAKPVETVCVHYPGTELAFFDQERGRLKALPDHLPDLRDPDASQGSSRDLAYL